MPSRKTTLPRFRSSRAFATRVCRSSPSATSCRPPVPAPPTRVSPSILRAHRDAVDAQAEIYRKARLRIDFKIWYYEEAKRLGGVAKLPPLDVLLARYRTKTGRSTDW